jgi:large subunit ribosomal protein L7/L12
MNEKQSRIDVLKKKKEQLNAQIQKLESLQKSRERKRDTRRKILIGACFMDKAAEDGSLDSLYQQLDGYLKRNSDRELFGLEGLPNEKESEPNEAIKGF